MTDIDKLSGRDLDAAVAEALGWEWDELAAGIGSHRIEGVPSPYEAFLPSSDLNDCRLAEMDIEKRGLERHYIANLSQLIDPDPESTMKQGEYVWRIRNADAETLCRAMIKTLKGE